MKKIAIFLLILLLSNCQNRRKSLNIQEFRSAEIEKIDSNTIVNEEKQEIKKVSDSLRIYKNQSENTGDIIIHGKSDSLSDFNFHNVVDGDTLSNILIRGNAEFTIKNKWKKSKSLTEKKSESESLDIVAKVARKAVAKSTIIAVAKEVKKSEKLATSKSFTFGAWIYGIVAFALVVLAVFAYFYLGGSIYPDWLKRFKERLRKPQ